MHAGVRSVLDDVHRLGRLPVVTFSAGGIATPADASLMMQMGMDGIFVGSGIFKSSDPPTMADAIVMANPAAYARYTEALVRGLPRVIFVHGTGREVYTSAE